MKLVMLFAAAAMLASPAMAQKWPDKPVKLIVPYPPGGNVDTAARIVAPGMQELLGQPVVVENKPGAGGLIAGEFVAKSPTDGYTLFFTANSPLLHAPIIFRRAAYHWEKDFVAVSSVSFTPIVLQVHPSVPAKSVKELLDLARAQPGKLAMSTPSAGTTNHLLSEFMQGATGVSWLTVHYKGNAPATTAMLAGEVQMGFDQVSVALPYIKQGRMRALAVTTEKRVASLPDVPTFAESGYPGTQASFYLGLAAPAGTPNAIIERIGADVRKAVLDRTFLARFVQPFAYEPIGDTPSEFAEFLKRDVEANTKRIRALGLKLEL